MPQAELFTAELIEGEPIYRVYQTTDGQNIGTYINVPAVGDYIEFPNGYVMYVSYVKLQSGNLYLTVSNPNYIVKAKRSG